MSSKNFKTINPSSIYKEVEFQDQPYSQTEKYKVYLPVEKDRVSELILRD